MSLRSCSKNAQSWLVERLRRTEWRKFWKSPQKWRDPEIIINFRFFAAKMVFGGFFYWTKIAFDWSKILKLKLKKKISKIQSIWIFRNFIKNLSKAWYFSDDFPFQLKKVDQSRKKHFFQCLEIFPFCFRESFFFSHKNVRVHKREKKVTETEFWSKAKSKMIVERGRFFTS